MLRSLTVAVLIMLGCGLLAIAQTDVSGSWTLTITSDQGSNDAPMTLEQDVTGSDIKWTAEIENPQIGALTLTFTGMVDGSDMKGEVDFGGFASGSWTAVKN